jgi:hypothetical protein
MRGDFVGHNQTEPLIIRINTSAGACYDLVSTLHRFALRRAWADNYIGGCTGEAIGLSAGDKRTLPYQNGFRLARSVNFK